MINTISNYIDEGKKSLETLLREKAYEDVASTLKVEGIDIAQVSEEDIETLVAEKTKDLANTLKGVAMGSVGAIVLSAILGI